jgi:hypothetical protein
MEREELYSAILDALGNKTPNLYGLDLEDEPGGVWFAVYSGFAANFTAQADVNRDVEELTQEAEDGFDAEMSGTVRMSLTVPGYVPYLLRELAPGPRSMGDTLTQLVVSAHKPKPTMGILERIEERLLMLERRLES